jgi:hypothetical protein
VPLCLDRSGDRIMLPPDKLALQAGDHLLFAGRSVARERQRSILHNPNIRDYVLTGNDGPAGWIWQRRRQAAVNDRR